jgi:hypothetical protein
MKLALVSLGLVACGSGGPAQPCAHRVRITLQRVDEDSGYMKRVFAHVGSEGRNDTPTDPAAIAAHVSAHLDSWTYDTTNDDGLPTGRTTYYDCYLVGRDKAALQGYLATLEPIDAAHEILLERVVPRDAAPESSPYWRTYYVRREVPLDDSSFVSVTLDQQTEGPIPPRRTVLIPLTADGKRRFGELTTATTGHKLAIVVDGTVQSAPIINSPILGGRFAITAASEAEATALAGKLGCPE